MREDFSIIGNINVTPDIPLPCRIGAGKIVCKVRVTAGKLCVIPVFRPCRFVETTSFRRLCRRRPSASACPVAILSSEGASCSTRRSFKVPIFHILFCFSPCTRRLIILSLEMIPVSENVVATPLLNHLAITVFHDHILNCLFWIKDTLIPFIVTCTVNNPAFLELAWPIKLNLQFLIGPWVVISMKLPIQ